MKKEIVGSMSEWSGALKDLFRQCDVDSKNLIRDWEKFYSGLGVKGDLSKVVIPDNPGGFERIIIMAQGVTSQWTYDKCQDLFKCLKWTDKNLDEMVISDRNAKNGSYAIRVRDRIEADEELKKLSANDIKDREITTETLEERLIHELKFFKGTDKHLDTKNVTLCSGSRYLNGHVPGAYWAGGKFWVLWYDAGYASGPLRSRSAVSCI